jgi:cysteine desulfurase
MRLPVYLDHQATTPTDPRVIESMMTYMREDFGNASSSDHLYGAKAAEAVEGARDRVAAVIGAKSEEIIFTSGATESDNLAILGASMDGKDNRTHFITTAIEHKAVLDSFKVLERHGRKVTYLPVDRDGIVSPGTLTESIKLETGLVSIMLANNEIGTIQRMVELSKIVHDYGAVLHIDAAQAVGHIPVNVELLNADLLSFSAHKVYGPKGVGGLYVRRKGRRVRIEPQLVGGGQERGLRSGTLNVPGIVGMGTALTLAGKEMDSEAQRVTKLRDRLQATLLEEGSVTVNGSLESRLPHNLNVKIDKVEGKALISSVVKCVAFSASSACTSQSVDPSHVLIAIGHTPASAHQCVRFGLGRWTTAEEVDYVGEVVGRAIVRLRKLRHE